MELVWLEDFLALAELGNFSRAAETRNVTQPAFSRRIRALEDWVGTPLFERASGGAVLTSAGEVFRPSAEDIVRRIRQTAREAREASGKEAATLRFAATHALSFTFFPPWMRALDTGEPFGSVRLVSDSMQACEELMLQGQGHFLLCHHHALAPGRFDPARFKSCVVGHDTLAPYVAPSADGAPLWALDTLATPIPYLAYSQESGLGRIVTSSILTDLHGRRLDTIFTSHLAAALLSMAREGRGVAWLPQSLAREAVEAKRLVPASAHAHWTAPLDIRLFRPITRQSPAAEAFWARVEQASAS